MAKCMLVCVVNIWLLFTTVQCDTPNTTTSSDCLEISTFHEASNNITSPNFPQPYHTGCEWEWTVNATGKSQLHIMFDSFDINNEAGDQLSIQIFEGYKEIGTKVIIEEGKEIKRSWDDNDEYRLVEFLFKAKKRNETNTHTGFSLHYKLSSNTSSQITNILPEIVKLESTSKDTNNTKTNLTNTKDTPASINGFIVINLDGKTLAQFTEEKDKFLVFMAELATAFCKAQNISSTNVSSSSVLFNTNPVMCSTDWPDVDLCITVNLSITIIDSTAKELNTPHLYTMWRTHSPDKLLGELGLKEYRPSAEENNLVLVLWLATTGTLFLLFLAILVIVLRTRVVENYIKRTRREHLGGYGVYERSRFAQPNQQQLVPPFFYPDERVIINQKNTQQYAVEPLRKIGIIGHENPAFVPENDGKKVANQISQEAIDDFDSDDDTIYPPSPLARQTSNRPQLKIANTPSSHELETTF